MVKTELEAQIDNLPDEFSIEELIESLILIEKINIGEEQSINRQVISDKELEKEMKTWFT